MPYPRRTDRSAIVSAAIEVLQEQGLERVSLRAIATRLGVRQPALYHHFSSKAVLLDAIAEEILRQWHTERLPNEGEPWEEFVARNARSLRRAMLSVRDGARLIASTGPRSPSPENATAQLACLEAAGFSGPEAALGLIAVARYTIGSTIEQQTAPDRGAIVVDSERKDPAAVRLREVAQQVASLGADAEFETGLTALVAGLARTGARCR